jgi:hypothetical protein
VAVALVERELPRGGADGATPGEHVRWCERWIDRDLERNPGALGLQAHGRVGVHREAGDGPGRLASGVPGECDLRARRLFERGRGKEPQLAAHGLVADHPERDPRVAVDVEPGGADLRDVGIVLPAGERRGLVQPRGSEPVPERPAPVVREQELRREVVRGEDVEIPVALVVDDAQVVEGERPLRELARLEPAVTLGGGGRRTNETHARETDGCKVGEPNPNPAAADARASPVHLRQVR